MFMQRDDESFYIHLNWDTHKPRFMVKRTGRRYLEVVQKSEKFGVQYLYFEKLHYAISLIHPHFPSSQLDFHYPFR